jgi:hypothetical protein
LNSSVHTEGTLAHDPTPQHIPESKLQNWPKLQSVSFVQDKRPWQAPSEAMDTPAEEAMHVLS